MPLDAVGLLLVALLLVLKWGSEISFPGVRGVGGGGGGGGVIEVQSFCCGGRFYW